MVPEDPVCIIARVLHLLGLKTLSRWAYLQQDDEDDGHLRTHPGEEALQLAALTNQVTVHYDGYQAHGFHGGLFGEIIYTGNQYRF